MNLPGPEAHRLVFIVNGRTGRSALVSVPADQIAGLDTALLGADSGDLSYYLLPHAAYPYTDTLREQIRWSDDPEAVSVIGEVTRPVLVSSGGPGTSADHWIIPGPEHAELQRYLLREHSGQIRPLYFLAALGLEISLHRREDDAVVVAIELFDTDTRVAISHYGHEADPAAFDRP